MATRGFQPGDFRRQVGSPRPKGRDNKDTLCRNVLIYGHCRYEDQGCAFNHDRNKTASNNADGRREHKSADAWSESPAPAQFLTAPASTSGDLAPESQSPAPTSLNLANPVAKKTTFSSQAVSAPAFTPRGVGATTPVPALTPQKEISKETEAIPFNPATREFTPSMVDLNPAVGGSNASSLGNGLSYDPFGMGSLGSTLPSSQYNPYAEDANSMGASSAAFYPTQASYAAPVQPLQHHLYFPTGPYRDDLEPYQRLAHDFFMPEEKRQEYQKKSDATRQVIQNSQIPQIGNFHSLVALDTNHRKSSSIFGFPSWVYKATSLTTGRVYCLRRLEGYKLSNTIALPSVKEWRKIINGSIVRIHDAFTTRHFGDSSLVFVQDFHPLSKSLAETHFPIPGQLHGGRSKLLVPENVLWSYIVQIANALLAIHTTGLAARCLDPSKIIITSKNRIRLNACSILDVIQFENRRTLAELQQDDLAQFGTTMLCLASITPAALVKDASALLMQLSRAYSTELRDAIGWLLSPPPAGTIKGIEEFMQTIKIRTMSLLNDAFHESDILHADMQRELENGRIARLALKLAVVNDRPEYDNEPAWSETGERYLVGLLRDYIFHQVDADGHPVVDLGHMLSALGKLDSGTQEIIRLTSRDAQTVFYVSFKELKGQVDTAYRALFKGKGKVPRNAP